MRVTFILILLVLSQFAWADPVSVRFGSLEITERIGESGYRFGFVQELHRVPLLTLSEGGAYGIEYDAAAEQSYTVQVTAVLPLGVRQGGGDVELVQELADSTVMVFEERTLKGAAVEPFLFSEGDPSGTYILVVRVNGAEHTTIQYEAYVPEAH